MVVLSLFIRVTLPPCGYCLKASMTDQCCFVFQNQDLQDCDDALHRFHPHPSPLPSRRPLQNLPSFPRRRESIVKRNLGEQPFAHIIAVRLSFAKVSIKGEGEYGWCCLVVALPFPSGLRIKSAMTVRAACLHDRHSRVGGNPQGGE